MSQMPPTNPYGQQPPPPYGQPPGYPPQGYPPPGYPPPGYPPARTSGSAVTSLIFGIVFCIPFVSGLLALIFGIVGVRATRSPAVRGRGMAVAGLVLGVIGLIGWTVYVAAAGVTVYALFNGAMNPMIAQQFFQRVSTGDTNAALKLCRPGTPAADVQATIDQMKSYGRMTSFNTSTTSTTNGDTTMSGTIDFANGSNHAFKAEVDKGSSGVPLVESWDLAK